MKYRFLFLLLSLLALSSCVTTPRYYLGDNSIKEPLKIDLTKKYVLVKNNVLSDDFTFDKKINEDFSSIFGNSLLLNYSSLDYNSTKLITKVRVEANMLDDIKANTGADFLILMRIFSKGNKKVEPDQFFKSVKIEDYEAKREYHIILQVYDLHQKKLLYMNEAASVLQHLRINDLSTTANVQLTKTYYRIFKDFKANCTFN